MRKIYKTQKKFGYLVYKNRMCFHKSRDRVFMVLSLILFKAILCGWVNPTLLHVFHVCEAIMSLRVLNLKEWLPLDIKQRSQRFRNWTTATIRPIWIFHPKTCWYSHSVIVVTIFMQHLVYGDQDRGQKVWQDLILLFKKCVKA